MRSKKADVRPENANWKLERADLKLERAGLRLVTSDSWVSYDSKKRKNLG